MIRISGGKNRITAIFAVLLLITLLFSNAGSINKEDTLRTDTPYGHISILQCGSVDIPAVIGTETYRSLMQQRVTRMPVRRGLYQPDGFHTCFCGDQEFHISAYIVYVVLRRLSGSCGRTHSEIIKYIHDQDGHKISSFVLK